MKIRLTSPAGGLEVETSGSADAWHLIFLAALTIPLGIAFYAINIYGAAVLNR